MLAPTCAERADLAAAMNLRERLGFQSSPTALIAERTVA